LHFLSSASRSADYNQLLQLWQTPLLASYALHQLPPDIPHFMGRQVEIQQATAILEQALQRIGTPASVLVIHGQAGVGKSALALHLAHQIKSTFAEVQLYANLRGTESQPLKPTEVLAGFLRELGLDEFAIPPSITERSQLLRSLIAGRRTVIVLDEVHNQAQVTPLIPFVSTCVVVLTSRQSLPTLPDAASLELAELSEPDALALLQRLSPNVASTRLLQLLQVCGGLPLTLCLVGGTLRALREGTDNYLERFIAEVERVTQLHLTYPAVRASFALSYQALEPEAAQLFRWLGLYGSATVTSTSIAALSKFDLERTRQLLHQLVQRYFLEALQPERYRWHDLIRLFAKEQLAIAEPTEARQAARLRLSRWYLETAELINLGLEPFSRQQLAQIIKKQQKISQPAAEQAVFARAFNWFEVEKANLFSAVEWAYQLEDWETVLLSQNLVHFLDLKQDWVEWQRTQRYALEAAQTLGDRRETARILNNLGNAAMRQGNWSEAKALYEESLAIFQTLADYSREAQTLVNLGVYYLEQGDQTMTVTLWRNALAKLLSDSTEQQKMLKWMRAIDELLVQTAASHLNDRQSSTGIFQTIGSMLKRLLLE
jgi:tetratricopeptide (TPR) repeat protein